MDSKINAITPEYASKLGLKTYFSKIKALKIDNFTFKLFEMVLAGF